MVGRESTETGTLMLCRANYVFLTDDKMTPREATRKTKGPLCENACSRLGRKETGEKKSESQPRKATCVILSFFFWTQHSSLVALVSLFRASH